MLFCRKDVNKYSLTKIKSNFKIVCFYPKDSTPSCTVEATEFTKHLDQTGKLRVSVIEISGRTDASKEKFCRRHNLKALLLSDPDFKVAKSHGAYGLKAFTGHSFDGIYRRTFLLDATNRLLKHFEKVKPDKHAEELVQTIRKFRAVEPRKKNEASKASVNNRAATRASRRKTS